MTCTSGPGNSCEGPTTQALRELLTGHQNTALLYVAAKLGLADLLADGPRTSVDLARSLGAHAPSLHRVLRGLAVLGVCAEEDDGRFRLTALGSGLQSGRAGSLRDYAVLSGEEYVKAWGGLLHSAMTGETAFDSAFGMSQWEHRRQHAELNEHFNAWLREKATPSIRAILTAYDFSSFGTVADVGGGHGALLAAILRTHPCVTGVLLDQPHVVADARGRMERAGVAARCRIVGGDFFDHIPEGADAHILKSVIHDWDDARSLVILRNCHRALVDRGTLLLIERVLPDRAEQDPDTIFMDLHMLAVTGGRERSDAEYRALLAAAGFRMKRTIPIGPSFHIIEGARTEAEKPEQDQPVVT